MTTISETRSCAPDAAGWPVAGQFIEAFAQRDFPAMAKCLHPDVTMRALLPPGPITVSGADEVAERFAQWFGGADSFEMLDAAIGRMGTRVYLRWRIGMRPAGGPGRVAEQHVFAAAGDRIETLDLLCSGFQCGAAE